MSEGADILDASQAGEVVRAPDYAGRWARALRERIVALVAETRDTDGRAVRWPRAVADVLEALARHASREGECWPSQETIARAISYSVRHVARAIGEAVRVGLLVAAVPDYAARVAAGATTRYALPWWSGIVRDGVRILYRAQAALRIETPARARMVARAIEAVDPAALLARVMGSLSREARAALVEHDTPRAYAATIYQRASDADRARWERAKRVDPWEAVQETPRPDKTRTSQYGPDQARSTPAPTGKDDRAPSAREGFTPPLPPALAAAMARWREKLTPSG